MKLLRASSHIALALVAFVSQVAPASAQTSGFSDYYILGAEDHVWRKMDRVRLGENAGAFATGVGRMNSVVSMTATANDQILYYDHWEDGLETTINPGSITVSQATTLVLGDADSSNGRVCDWSTDPRVSPCNGVPSHDDVLFAGTSMSLASDQGVAGTCAAPYAAVPSLAQVRCSFPIRPPITSITSAAGLATVTTALSHGFTTGMAITISGANQAPYNGTFTITSTGATTFTYPVAGGPASPATGTLTLSRAPSIRFDGGDRVFNVGGSLSIAHVQDPGSPLIGGGTELLSRELVKAAVAYSIPIGENLAPGANNAYASAKYTSIDIVAFDDNTSITVNSPGAGTRSLVLHRGQHYTSCMIFVDSGTAGVGGIPGPCTAGAIDGPPPSSGPDNRGVFPALALAINSGTKISTGAPLNVLIFTGGHGAYQTRHYATLPDILHTTDYVTTAPGDDGALQGTSNKNLFIYNPSPTAAINVTRTDSSGSSTFSVPANSVVDYRNQVGTFVPANSTVRLTSTSPFWGLTAYDATGLNRDWGHAWLGVRFLATDYTVAYSPGTQFIPITSITHAAGTVTVNTGINHILTNASSVRLEGVTMPVASLTSVGTTATANIVGHGLIAGQSVTISGATTAGANNYNGTFLIATAAANSFTYTMSAPSLSPAGGTILATSTVNGNRVLTAVPTATQVQFALPGASAAASGGTIVGVCDAASALPCNSYNRDPVWVAGTRNNTNVSVDFNADGLFDYIDFNSDNCPDNGDVVTTAGYCQTPPVIAGCPALNANQCVYRVSAPGSTATRNTLRVWDYNDLSNAGTRIVASQPVALSWGEDTDQGQGGDPSPDNGYTIYPDIVVDLVLGIDKEVTPSRVPTGGTALDRTANYSIRVFAGDYGPITFLNVHDTLPPGVECSDYVPGSTVVTYPDLSTTTVDPTCTDNVAPARDVLEWTPTPATLNINQQTVITYRVVIPTSAVPRSLTNDAEAVGNLGDSIFRPRDSATINQSDLDLVKSVTHDGSPEVGDILTYTVQVTNGTSAETGVTVSDAIPSFTTYVPNSLTTTNEISAPAASLTRAGATATYRATVPHGWSTGTFVTVVGAIQPEYNGRFSITVPAAAANTGVTWAAGGGGTVTITSAGHGHQVGDWVTISGVTPAAYNGTFQILTAAANTFTYSLAPNPGVAGVLGNQQTASRFTYAVPGAPATPATGTIHAKIIEFDTGQNAVVWSGPLFGASATGTMTFQVRISDSTPTGATIDNFANYSSGTILSANSNVVSTPVVGPNLVITKSGPAGPLHPNQLGAFELTVTNNGTGFARNLVITDTISGGNLTYEAGTMQWSLNAGAFVSLTDAVDADPGSFAANVVTFAPLRAVTSLTRVGTLATVTTTTPHGWVTGQAVLIAGATSDPTLYNGSFTITVTGANTFTYTMSGVPVTSPATGTITADTPLAPGSTIRLRFDARVNPGTGGLFASNQAQVTATGQPLTSSNLYQVPIVGDATVTGHVFLDINGNGTQDPGEPDLSNVTVTVTDSSSVVQLVTTDSFGNYTVVVPPGTTTLNVDETDPDFPTGSTLTTANDPQNVIAVAGSTVASTNVGYQPPPMTISKTSSAGGTVAPGDVVTYTIRLSNNTGVTQTGIRITDSVPANTTYVPGSAAVQYPTGNAFRVTEYLVPGASFTGLTHTLTLAQNLAPDYFVIVRGSDANGTNDTTPAQNYAALTADPFATGDLANSGNAAQIVLTRNGDDQNWQGVVTVVECISDCDVNGFRLRSAERVAMTGATASGTDSSLTPWTNLSRVALIGGYRGAGCNTGEANALDHETCHARLFPSGTQTINWLRTAAAGGSLETATATVMVVEWGSNWTVQRVNVTGNNGGDGLNAAGEYNTGAIAGVVRANTWVWGTGFTSDSDAGESAEAAIVTLGNGAVANATETLVAVGTEEPEDNVTVDFDVYVMSHLQLSTNWHFKTDGDSGNATVNVATPSVTANRMAQVYNGNADTGNNYPRSIFASRYSTSINIELLRRRTGTDFPAWVQGIGFNGVPGATSVTCLNIYPPVGLNCTAPTVNPNIVDPAATFTLPPGQSMTVTFQVTVNNPLPGAVTTINNTAVADSTQSPTDVSASTVDSVVRPRVRVEPNNAGFAAPGTTILFSQNVTNLGTTTDSFTLTLASELANWKVELLDPDTGAVIATDTDGDGVWDGGVSISTGPLAVNESKPYTVRVTVPPGATPATQNTVELTAVSALSPLVSDVGTDEITVLDLATFGPVILMPDHSGIVAAGDEIAYTHRLYNNTGSSGNFDIRVDTQLGWPTTVHADTNGDGVYTPGVDLALSASPTAGFLNGGTLADGASRLLFVVTTAPPGTPPGTEDVAHLTARSRSNPVLVDAATDTTTVMAPGYGVDLAGGGTRFASPGDTTKFPGTLYNLTSSPTRYDISISPASLFGVDGLNHPTVLRVDLVGGDGIPDTVIAIDTDGNGTWDQLCAALPPCVPADSNNNGNSLPDILVPANGEVAYELERVIPASQEIWKEYVTITAASFDGVTTPVSSLTSSGTTATVTSADHGLVVGQTITISGATVGAGVNTYNGTFVVTSVPNANEFTYTMLGDPVSDTAGGSITYTTRHEDSVTAQWIIAALSRASIRGLRVDPAGVVEFVTSTQQNTAFFDIFATRARSRDGERRRLNSSSVISPAPDSLLPILYRVQTPSIDEPYLLIQETEISGNTIMYGPYSITNTRLRRGLERVEARMNRVGVSDGPVRISKHSLAREAGASLRRARRPVFGPRRGGVSSSLLLTTTGRGTLSVPLSTLESMGMPPAASRRMRLTRAGTPVPFTVTGGSLVFDAEPFTTDLTSEAAYVLAWPRSGDVRSPVVGFTRTSDPERPDSVRVERNWIYGASVPSGDSWQWDLLFGDGRTWPYPEWDPNAGTFDLPTLAIGVPGHTVVRLRVTGMTAVTNRVVATINGIQLAEIEFSGRTTALLEGTVPNEALLQIGNRLTVNYTSLGPTGAPSSSGYLYVDYLDLAIPQITPPTTAALASVRVYDPGLPSTRDVQYLVVTHPDFEEQANRLASIKTASGLKAAVLGVHAAYDRYSAGVPEPAAIAAAIRDVAGNGKLQYVVLLGDDTLDPRDFSGAGEVSYIPSTLGRDTHSRVPNDNAFADLDGNGSPELAIGRLPATTIEEARVMIDKIEAQTQTLAESGNVHIFVSDDSRETDFNFSESALAMSQLLPAGATSVIADVGAGIGPARSTMFGTWRSGSTMTHYFGHGGPEIWTDEALFNVEDVSTLGEMPPMVLLAWACQSQFFQNFYGPSINEALMLSPGNGALASFGPVGISSPEHQRAVYEKVYARLFAAGESIGEIIRKAKVAALEEDPRNQDVVDGFVFFGDPSLTLPAPPGGGSPTLSPKKQERGTPRP